MWSTFFTVPSTTKASIFLLSDVRMVISMVVIICAILRLVEPNGVKTVVALNTRKGCCEDYVCEHWHETGLNSINIAKEKFATLKCSYNKRASTVCNVVNLCKICFLNVPIKFSSQFEDNKWKCNRLLECTMSSINVSSQNGCQFNIAPVSKIGMISISLFQYITNG